MPFLIPLISIALGILIGYHLNGILWGALPIFLGLGYYLFLLNRFQNPLKALKGAGNHFIWIFLLCLGLGIMDMTFRKPIEFTQNKINSLHTAQGVITDHKYSTSGDRFNVRIDYITDLSGNKKSYPNLTILLYTDGLSAVPGDILIFPAKLRRITDNPNYRPNGYPDRMKKKGIIYRSTVKTNDIKIIGHQKNFNSISREWRDRLIILLEKSSLERPTINFLTALLLGDQSFIGSDTRETFSNAGIAHILALSGTHVAIVMGLIMFMLFPLSLFGLHKWRYVIAVAMIWFYAYLSGLAPSTVRACIMSTFIVIAISIQRKNAPGNALLASAFFILLFDPYALFDIGMQLSFLCVASILIFTSRLNTVSRHYHPLTYSFINSLLISLITTLSTWIVISYYFNNIPLLFLPANIILLPILPLYMGIALFYLLLLVIGFDSSTLSLLLDKSYEYMISIADTLSMYGTSTINYRAHIFSVILWLIGIGIFGYIICSKNKNEQRQPENSRIQNRILLPAGIAAIIIALIAVPFIKTASDDCIIFQKNYREINLALYSGEQCEVISLPRYTVSTIHHKDNMILSIDGPLDSTIIEKICKASDKYKNRFLIIGAGYKKGNLKNIPNLDEYRNIILHSSMRRSREASLLHEADEIYLRNVHSLRQSGPLTIDL